MDLYINELAARAVKIANDVVRKENKRKFIKNGKIIRKVQRHRILDKRHHQLCTNTKYWNRAEMKFMIRLLVEVMNEEFSKTENKKNVVRLGALSVVSYKVNNRDSKMILGSVVSRKTTVKIKKWFLKELNPHIYNIKPNCLNSK